VCYNSGGERKKTMPTVSVLEPETEVRPFETCSFLWGSRNYLLRRPVQILFLDLMNGLLTPEAYLQHLLDNAVITPTP